MLLDIVILPPAHVGRILTRATKKACAGLQIIYIVDDMHLYHHLSLFHMRARPSEMPQLIAQIRKTLTSFKPIMITSKRAAPFGRGIEYHLSGREKLKGINQKIVKTCAPLRTGMMPWTSTHEPTQSQLNKRKRYGTQLNIGSSFKPHFTLAKCKEKDDALKVIKRIGKLNFRFMTSTIGLCEVNYNHQVTKILKKFKV